MIILKRAISTFFIVCIHIIYIIYIILLGTKNEVLERSNCNGSTFFVPARSNIYYIHTGWYKK